MSGHMPAGWHPPPPSFSRPPPLPYPAGFQDMAVHNFPPTGYQTEPQFQTQSQFQAQRMQMQTRVHVNSGQHFYTDSPPLPPLPPHQWRPPSPAAPPLAALPSTQLLPSSPSLPFPSRRNGTESRTILPPFSLTVCPQSNTNEIKPRNVTDSALRNLLEQLEFELRQKNNYNSGPQNNSAASFGGSIPQGDYYSQPGMASLGPFLESKNRQEQIAQSNARGQDKDKAGQGREKDVMMQEEEKEESIFSVPWKVHQAMVRVSQKLALLEDVMAELRCYSEDMSGFEKEEKSKAEIEDNFEGTGGSKRRSIVCAENSENGGVEKGDHCVDRMDELEKERISGRVGNSPVLNLQQRSFNSGGNQCPSVGEKRKAVSEEVIGVGVDLDTREKRKRRAVNVALKLETEIKTLLAPLERSTSINTGISALEPWELSLLEKRRQKVLRNRRWRKKKRRRVAEALRKEREKFEELDRAADEWRARELANTIAQRKMEELRESAEFAAEEDRRATEKELEMVLMLEHLQELRDLRIAKLRRQGHLLPDEDDKFMERVRAAVEEEERMVATSQTAAAIASAEQATKWALISKRTSEAPKALRKANEETITPKVTSGELKTLRKTSEESTTIPAIRGGKDEAHMEKAEEVASIQGNQDILTVGETEILDGVCKGELAIGGEGLRKAEGHERDEYRDKANITVDSPRLGENANRLSEMTQSEFPTSIEEAEQVEGGGGGNRDMKQLEESEERSGHASKEGRNRGQRGEEMAHLDADVYNYYYGSRGSMSRLVEVRRHWDAFIMPGGSRIPGHWVEPPPPSDSVWASYLIHEDKKIPT